MRSKSWFPGFLEFLRRHTWLALVVFSLGPVLVLRVYLINLYLADDPSPSWLLAATRGVVSDAAYSLTLALVLWRPLNGTATGPLVVGALLSLLHAANHEHLLYNHAHANFALTGLGFTKEVLLGNVLIVPVFAKAAIAFAVSLTVMFGVSLVASRQWSWSRLLPGALLALIIALPLKLDHPDFVQTSVYEVNLRHLVRALRAPGIEPGTPGAGTEGADRFHPRDLSGSPVVSFPGNRPNILMVLVEGWGRAVLEAGHTPKLEALTSSSLYFPNVIAHQVQTHRGLYSILCGDYPNLLLHAAKSDVIGQFGIRRPCLPEMLAQHGYETVFMQSAGLDFMRKDRFAAAVGFGEIHGAEHYPGVLRSEWGVDDGTLMQGARERIARLSDGGAPWMMTLLTSGTHPPYFVPDSYTDHPDAGLRERAFRFADQVTADLLEALRSDGRLDNTWVLILSDETSIPSQGAATSHPEFQSEYANRANIVVLAPGRQRRRLAGFYGYKDIMISMLDLLGLDSSAARGRSLFREYSGSSPILYASLYTGRFFIRTGVDLIMCVRTWDKCSGFRRDDVRSRLVDREPDWSLVAAARGFTRTNDLGYPDRGEVQTVFEERKTLYGQERRRVIGNRHMGAKPGDLVVWRVVLSAPASNRGISTARLVRYVTDIKQTRTWTIEPGQTIRFTDDRVFDRSALVTSELFLSNQRDDALLVQEVSIVKTRRRKE